MTIYQPLAGKSLAAFENSSGGGNLFEGAVRAGKTVASIYRWLDYVVHGPAGPLAMIGRTERTLKRNVLDPIAEMIGTRMRVRSGIGEAEICGRTVYLLGANDSAAVSKIQGMTLAGWYGDEVATWPEEVFDAARTRLSVPGAQWFGTCNPAAKNHYLNLKHIKRAALHIRQDGTIIRRHGPDAIDMHVFSFVIYDNPTLTKRFLRRLEREYTGVFRLRYILGQWAAAEGAIFPEFDPERHVMPRAKMPAMTEFLAGGIDYGTANPFSAHLLGLGPDPERHGEQKLYVTHEYWWDSRAERKQLSDVEYSAGLRKWLRDAPMPGAGSLTGIMPEMVAVDPSAASLRVQLYRDGLPSRAAKNEVVDSIRVAGSLLAQDKIVFAEECPWLIDETPAYVWDDAALKRGEEKPLKLDDHAIDSGLRYAPFTSRHVWADAVWGLAA